MGLGLGSGWGSGWGLGLARLLGCPLLVALCTLELPGDLCAALLPLLRRPACLLYSIVSRSLVSLVSGALGK